MTEALACFSATKTKIACATDEDRPNLIHCSVSTLHQELLTSEEKVSHSHISAKIGFFFIKYVLPFSCVFCQFIIDRICIVCTSAARN